MAAAYDISVLHGVVHCRQRSTWDCGIACVMMLLPAGERQHLQANMAHVCLQEGFGRNTWNIDLCHLLRRYGVTSQLHTTTIGVNEGHRTRKFYQKHFHKDRERVKERFESAISLGIECFERRVTNDEIERWLSVGPLILLVDADTLTCQLCKHNKLTSQFRWLSGSYRGHYIVCAAVVAGRVYYMDPARSHVCVTSLAEMARARTQRGTDQDIIRIIRK